MMEIDNENSPEKEIKNEEPMETENNSDEKQETSVEVKQILFFYFTNLLA